MRGWIKRQEQAVTNEKILELYKGGMQEDMIANIYRIPVIMVYDVIQRDYYQRMMRGS